VSDVSAHECTPVKVRQELVVPYVGHIRCMAFAPWEYRGMPVLTLRIARVVVDLCFGALVIGIGRPEY